MSHFNLPELMAQAYLEAELSPDPSNQNGAMLLSDASFGILSRGYNGFGRIKSEGIDLVADRDWKMANIEHAERACLFSCAKQYETNNSIMICPWACCCDCGRAIARMGVRKLIVHTPRMETTPDRWKQSVEDGLNILRAYDVQIEYYDGDINLRDDFTIKANGEDWSPVEASRRASLAKRVVTDQLSASDIESLGLYI